MLTHGVFAAGLSGPPWLCRSRYGSRHLATRMKRGSIRKRYIVVFFQSSHIGLTEALTLAPTECQQTKVFQEIVRSDPLAFHYMILSMRNVSQYTVTIVAYA